MMQSCEYFREQISALMDNELSEEEKAELFAHLETCPSCKTVLENYQTLSEGFGLLSKEPSRPIGDSVLFFLKPKKEHFFTRYKFTIVAACMAIVIFVANQYYEKPAPAPQDPPLAKMAQDAKILPSNEKSSDTANSVQPYSGDAAGSSSAGSAKPKQKTPPKETTPPAAKIAPAPPIQNTPAETTEESGAGNITESPTPAPESQPAETADTSPAPSSDTSPAPSPEDSASMKASFATPAPLVPPEYEKYIVEETETEIYLNVPEEEMAALIDYLTQNNIAFEEKVGTNSNLIIKKP